MDFTLESVVAYVQISKVVKVSKFLWQCPRQLQLSGFVVPELRFPNARSRASGPVHVESLNISPS